MRSYPRDKVDDTFVLGIQISYVAYFLCGEEDSNFIEEEVKEVWGESAGCLGVELRDELVDVGEGFYSFGVHLLFDFVEDLIGFVFPVHAVTKIIDRL